MRALLLLCVVALGCAALASAATLSVSSAALTTGEAGTCTVPADRDTHLDELLSMGSHGTAADLHVKSQFAANQRTLVHFDLSACSIPPSATVVSATLRLKLTTTPAPARSHNLFRVTAPWTEATTWSSKPAVASTASASSSTGVTAGATVSWVATDDVRQWIAGSAANEGWQIADQTESAVVAVDTSYAAREHATAASQPRLFVAWRP